MEISFPEVEIRDLCCSRDRLVRRFGVEVARRVCCRLSMLSAASSLAIIPTFPPVGLTAVDRKGTYHVTVGDELVLVLRGLPLEAVRAGDLARIAEVQIIGLAPPAATGKKP